MNRMACIETTRHGSGGADKMCLDGVVDAPARLSRLFLVAILAAVLALTPAVAARASADLEAGKRVVADLGSEAVAAISNETLDKQQRADAFRTLLERGFDMERIARLVLGRHWHGADDAERDRYMSLFRESVVQTYVRQFDEYSGETIQVQGAREDGRYVLVDSVIRRPTSADVTVEWRMQESAGAYKVIDVKVEGVSMAINQRAEFDAIIQRQGGTLAALNDVLESRLNR